MVTEKVYRRARAIPNPVKPARVQWYRVKRAKSRCQCCQDSSGATWQRETGDPVSPSRFRSPWDSQARVAESIRQPRVPWWRRRGRLDTRVGGSEACAVETLVDPPGSAQRRKSRACQDTCGPKDPYLHSRADTRQLHPHYASQPTTYSCDKMHYQHALHKFARRIRRTCDGPDAGLDGMEPTPDS